MTREDLGTEDLRLKVLMRITLHRLPGISLRPANLKTAICTNPSYLIFSAGQRERTGICFQTAQTPPRHLFPPELR